MLSRRTVLAIGPLAVAFAAALASPAAAQSASPLPVVATFSILGDLVKEVGGQRVAVTTLVGPDGDTHVYQPTPADAKAVAGAAIVFENGLGLEGWMERLAKSSGGKAKLVVATEGVTPRYRTRSEPQDDDEADASSHKGHDHGALDPHAWQSVKNVEIYVRNIRDALIAADPAGKDAYSSQADAYLAKLADLDKEVTEAMARIPANQRRIITSHDAFGYFGEAYGLKLIAPEGMSTEAEASAKDIAAVIRQIKAEKIPAVFIENITDPRLVEQVARESGAKVGGTLYSDARSEPGTDGGTYLDLMRHNIRELASALTR
jgi:zinc/manganese transport system substrate-binding protein